MPNIAHEQVVIAAAITIALILYLHASDVHQHCVEALTSEVGLL